MNNYKDSFFVINNEHAIDFREYAALKGAKRTLANGYVLTTDDTALQSFFDEWTNENGFEQYMFVAEKMMRHWGRTVLVLLYTQGKTEIQPNLGVPWIMNDVSSPNFMGVCDAVQAQIWLRMHSTVLPQFTRATLTRTSTTLEFYKDSIVTLSGNAKLPLSARVPTTVNYKLPFVPVVDCVNMPWYNAFATNLYNAYPDWRPVEGIIKIMNNLIYHFNVEMVANQTRVFYNGIEGDQNIMEQQRKTYMETHPEQFLNTDTQDPNNTKIYTQHIKEFKKLLPNFFINVPTKGLETPNKLIEILQASPIFETYSKAIDYWLQFFMNGCGLNHDTKDSSVNTATETMINQNDESIDLTLRRRLRNKYYTNFLMKLCIMSTDPRVAKFNTYQDFLNEKNQRIFNFQINDEKTKLTLEERQMLLTEFQNGLLSLEDYIQRTQGLTQAEAKSKAEILRKEHDEDIKDNLIENDNNKLEKDIKNTEDDEE